jgi:hypothetical protein
LLARLLVVVVAVMVHCGNSGGGGKVSGSGGTQRPKRRDFERDLYKMALKIALAVKFLLNVQPELHQAIGERSCTNSNICT